VEGSRAGLIVAGVEVAYSRKRPNFDRVTKLLIGGQPWDPDKIYTVATTDFLMQGNAGLTMLMSILPKT
jgi:2',3'-cyclic-nucleotide 2'-phosphodiesterase (5'-nucleotidase family)